jgi:hypothetical protein
MTFSQALTIAQTLRLQLEAMQTILDDWHSRHEAPEFHVINRMSSKAHAAASDLCLFLAQGPTPYPTGGQQR